LTMQMLHLHDFITDHLADRERALRKRERERLSKRSALDTQSSHVVGSKPNTIKEKQHG
jgi:hypothetical protein